MNAEQKQRIAHEISDWMNAEHSIFYPATAIGDRMVALLQELAEAPEPEPFGYFKAEPLGWTDCAETDDGAIALYETPPAPSVPEVDPVAKVTGYYGGYLSISTIDGRVLPAGTALYLAPPAPSVPDSVASEPVGYLYTNVQSGESHVSDYDDDYRGPERALWCIEPVYRRAKG